MAARPAAGAAPVLLRLANLAAAPDSARIGFAFSLEGPPLVDELSAGALTAVLPGPPATLAQPELWVLPRGLTLPRSLPEPLPLLLPEPADADAQPLRTVTIFLIDRPGPRGEPVRQLVAGDAPAAAAAQLRVLNLLGSAALDVCASGQTLPLTQGVPAWGLSRAPQWFAAAPPAATAASPAAESAQAAWMEVRVASTPPCRGEALAAVARPERGTSTLALLPAAATATRDPQTAAAGLRALRLDEASLAPERAVPLPVRPVLPGSTAKSVRTWVR